MGTAALSAIQLAGGAAQAAPDAPSAVTANITGGDHFVHPGLLVNNHAFPTRITVARAGRSPSSTRPTTAT